MRWKKVIPENFLSLPESERKGIFQSFRRVLSGGEGYTKGVEIREGHDCLGRGKIFLRKGRGDFNDAGGAPAKRGKPIGAVGLTDFCSGKL